MILRGLFQKMVLGIGYATISEVTNTTQPQLPRNSEKVLNRAKCDLLFRSNLYSHNFLIIHVISEPICPCGEKIQTTQHVFLQCQLLANFPTTLFQNLSSEQKIFPILNSRKKKLDRCQLLLHGDANLPLHLNEKIMNETSIFLTCIPYLNIAF
jgi:hypothetical protein